MNILDLLQRGVTGFNGLFAPTQGVGLPPSIPGNDLPSQGGIAGNIPPGQKPGFPGMPPMGFPMGGSSGASAMDSPAVQIGLRMLMNSSRQPGPRRGLGDIVGSSVLGYQQDSREQQMQKLQAQMLQARMDEMKQPQKSQEPAQLALLRALQADPEMAAAYEKYIKPQGGDALPSSLQEWAAFQKMSPDEQKQYLNMKRQPTMPAVIDFMGGKAWADRVNQTINPISNAQQEGLAQGAVAEGKAVGQARGEAQGALEKKGINAKTIIAQLDIADPLIEAATGSVAGAGRDKLAAVFGEAPQGAQAIAQLKVLQSNLMLNMPRMEGPQSDRDVMLYREAAGQIGDPMVPAAIKKAAVGTIRKLQEQYAGAPSKPKETAAERAKRLGL